MLEVVEFLQRRPDVLLQRMRQLAQIPPEERVVPGQDLIDHHVAVAFKAARTARDAHAQRKGVTVNQPRRQGKDDGAVQAAITEFVRLHDKTRALLPWFRAYPRLQVDDPDVPAACEHVSRA